MNQTIPILVAIVILLIPAVRSASNSYLASDYARLKQAVMDSDLKAIKTLLDQGVNPNAPDQVGYPPLLNLNRWPDRSVTDIEIAELLINAGADVNHIQQRWGLTPLLYVCADIDVPFSKELIELLLDAGADPNVADIDGLTALMYVFNRPNRTNLDNLKLRTDIVKMLTSHEADVNAKDFKGKTAVDYARTWYKYRRETLYVTLAV